MKPPIDKQMQLVYDAEYNHSYYNKKDIFFKTIQEADKWLNACMTTKWFVKRYSYIKYFKVDIIPSNSIICFPIINRIEIPTDFLNPLILLHELSHLCNKNSYKYKLALKNEGFIKKQKYGYSSHGKHFCGIYLDLVKQFLGKECSKELKVEFDKRYIKY